MIFASPSSLNSSTTRFYTAEESLKQEAPYLDNPLINLPGFIFIRSSLNRDLPGGQLAGVIHHLGDGNEREDDENDITIKDKLG